MSSIKSIFYHYSSPYEPGMYFLTSVASETHLQSLKSRLLAFLSILSLAKDLFICSKISQLHSVWYLLVICHMCDLVICNDVAAKVQKKWELIHTIKLSALGWEGGVLTSLGEGGDILVLIVLSVLCAWKIINSIVNHITSIFLFSNKNFAHYTWKMVLTG